MIEWLHTNIPQAIFFAVGPIKIYWYGFLMIVGGLLGFLLVLRLAKFFQVKKSDLYDLAFWWILAGIIGGRIYYVLYSFSYYKDHLDEIIKIWQGGLAVHGVLIGGFIATFIFGKKKQINFWQLADLIVVGFVLAQVIGRWGNYFNQEIFGRPTELSWGIPIEIAKRPIEYLQYKYFHPTFLYESIGNLIIFSDLLALTWLKLKQPHKIFCGLIFCYYLMMYSVLRFCLEFLRLDDSPLVFGIRWAQIFSLIIFILAVGLLIYLKVKSKVKQLQAKIELNQNSDEQQKK